MNELLCFQTQIVASIDKLVNYYAGWRSQYDGGIHFTKPGGSNNNTNLPVETEYDQIKIGSYYITTTDGLYIKPSLVSTDTKDYWNELAGGPQALRIFDMVVQNDGYSFKAHFNSDDNRMNVYTHGYIDRQIGVGIYEHTGHSTQTRYQ